MEKHNMQAEGRFSCAADGEGTCASPRTYQSLQTRRRRPPRRGSRLFFPFGFSKRRDEKVRPSLSLSAPSLSSSSAPSFARDFWRVCHRKSCTRWFSRVKKLTGQDCLYLIVCVMAIIVVLQRLSDIPSYMAQRSVESGTDQDWQWHWWIRQKNPSGLRVATWNVARPGGESNPFALWVQGGNTRSHSMKEGADRELQQRLDLFMLEAQDILDEVARYGFDREMVTVGDVFTEEMFENLERHAIREGLTETGWDRYEKPHDSSTAHTSKPPSPGAPPAWPLDAMRQAYELDLRHRTLTNGFLRDETLHDKRLLVAFDELTAAVPLPTKQTKVKTHGTADMEGGGRNRGFEVNEKAQQETKDARNTENGFRYRPAVTTCHAKPFANTHNGNLTAWFHQWLEFMFEGPARGVHSLMKHPMRRSEYPALTAEEARASPGLMLLTGAIADAIILRTALIASAGSGIDWHSLRSDICDSTMLLGRRRERAILNILRGHKDPDAHDDRRFGPHAPTETIDILFLQGVSDSLLARMNADRGLNRAFLVVSPSLSPSQHRKSIGKNEEMDRKREKGGDGTQSMILLNRKRFHLTTTINENRREREEERGESKSEQKNEEMLPFTAIQDITPEVLKAMNDPAVVRRGSLIAIALTANRERGHQESDENSIGKKNHDKGAKKDKLLLVSFQALKDDHLNSQRNEMWRLTFGNGAQAVTQALDRMGGDKVILGIDAGTRRAGPWSPQSVVATTSASFKQHLKAETTLTDNWEKGWEHTSVLHHKKVSPKRNPASNTHYTTQSLFTFLQPDIKIAARRCDISNGLLTRKDPRDYVLFSRSLLAVDMAAGGVWRWTGTVTRRDGETQTLLRPYDGFKALPALDWPTGHAMVTTDLVYL